MGYRTEHVVELNLKLTKQVAENLACLDELGKN